MIRPEKKHIFVRHRRYLAEEKRMNRIEKIECGFYSCDREGGRSEG